MKIYLFNPENGCYLGEDFADEGIYPVPSDATTVAPPRPGPGEVAVYDLVERTWTLILRSALRTAPFPATANG